jgi:hypothetical protein
MRYLVVPAVGALAWFAVGLEAQGPKKESSETVARPRKKGTPDKPEESEQPKIPSKLGKKGDKQLPTGIATFRSDTTTVSVDVAVLDNKGRFIPKIPAGNFRVLEPLPAVLERALVSDVDGHLWFCRDAQA